MDFQVDGARHFTLLGAHEMKQAIPCIVIFLYLPYFRYLCGLDGVVKP